jgi:integrase
MVGRWWLEVVHPDDSARGWRQGLRGTFGATGGSAGEGHARRAGITRPISAHSLRSSFITAALDAGVPLRDVREAASHADARTATRCDRARPSLDRHTTYNIAAFVAGAAR